jgi:RNA polymerase sigma factor (sigma-70 family)
VKVADFLDVPPDEVCPPELRKAHAGLDRIAFRQVNAERLFARDEMQRLTLPSPDEAIERRDLYEVHLKPALAKLTCREREIIKLRYGLDGREPMTLDEVAKVFKVTRERVRAKQCSGEAKLRAALAGNAFDFELLKPDEEVSPAGAPDKK